MSTSKKATPAPQEETTKTTVEPIKENELGQIEGGFSEIQSTEPSDPGLNISCPTNQSQCG